MLAFDRRAPRPRGTSVALLAGFKPTMIGGAQLWLAADQPGSGYNDGDLVGSWTDLSGNGATVSQGTGAAKPTFKKAIINGLPVMRFAGAQLLTTTAAGLNLPNNWTSFVVMQGTSTSSDQMAISWGVPGTTGTRRATYIQITNGFAAFSGYNANVISSLLVKDGNPHIITITCTAGNAVVVYVDGVSRATGTPALAAYTYQGLGVGGNVTGSEYYTDDLAELGVYSGVVGADDLTKLTRYLGAKYRISVP